jgi:hypothetical protein
VKPALVHVDIGEKKSRRNRRKTADDDDLLEEIDNFSNNLSPLSMNSPKIVDDSNMEDKARVNDDAYVVKDENIHNRKPNFANPSPYVEISDEEKDQQGFASPLSLPSVDTRENMSPKNNSRSNTRNAAKRSPKTSNGIHIIERRRSLYNVQDLLAFFENGVPVVKYGRSGFPKRRILKYDAEKNEIRLETPLDKKKNSILSLFSSNRKESDMGKNENIKSISISSVTGLIKGINADAPKSLKHHDPLCVLTISCHQRNFNLLFTNGSDRDKCAKTVEALMQSKK